VAAHRIHQIHRIHRFTWLIGVIGFTGLNACSIGRSLCAADHHLCGGVREG
jgi:hypothetical protein